jgi:hypothetical protein
MENTPGAKLAGVFSFLSRGIRTQKITYSTTDN